MSAGCSQGRARVTIPTTADASSPHTVPPEVQHPPSVRSLAAAAETVTTAPVPHAQQQQKLSPQVLPAGRVITQAILPVSKSLCRKRSLAATGVAASETDSTIASSLTFPISASFTQVTEAGATGTSSSGSKSSNGNVSPDGGTVSSETEAPPRQPSPPADNTDAVGVDCAAIRSEVPTQGLKKVSKNNTFFHFMLKIPQKIFI